MLDSMSALRVLIVDDQISFRRRLRELLTRAGMTVVAEAENIPQALEETKKWSPDLAVVDVFLPGESGVDGAPKLKALAPNMRIILVSAQYDSSRAFIEDSKKGAGHSRMAKELSLKPGVEAFIPKDDLELEVVKKWIVNS